MKSKLFDYIEKDNFVFNLSGVTKLLCFLLLSFGVMLSFDARVVIAIMLISFIVLHVSEIKFRQVRIMMFYILGFLVINFILTYLFSPHYGEQIYGTSHEIFRFTDHYTVTLEQLLYQGTKLLKYASVVPLGMMFIFTTNPSEFAASLNRIGVGYKAAFAVSLTLRYFPDMIRDYTDISLAQQARGLDLSRKEKLGTRFKNMINIFVPLIFSSLDRVEVVSNAMDLRGFGKNKKRTWYAAKPMTRNDWLSLIVCALVFAGSLCMTAFVNHSRFWNPFV